MIGASLGLCLRKTGICREIIGVARHDATIRKALKIGAISKGEADLKKAVSGADLVILAAPVNAIKDVLRDIGKKIESGCLVFDVGSTKKEILAAAKKFLNKNSFFIGTHPMAGSEKSGPEFARADLFRDSITFVVRPAGADKDAFSRVCALWQKTGSRVHEIKAQEHDSIVAQISHLPHILSAALVNSVAPARLKFAAGGFKDTTRIAGGEINMWADILLTNKKEVLRSLFSLEKEIARIKKSVSAGNTAALLRELKAAKQKRDSLNG